MRKFEEYLFEAIEDELENASKYGVTMRFRIKDIPAGTTDDNGWFDFTDDMRRYVGKVKTFSEFRPGYWEMIDNRDDGWWERWLEPVANESLDPDENISNVSHGKMRSLFRIKDIDVGTRVVDEHVAFHFTEPMKELVGKVMYFTNLGQPPPKEVSYDNWWLNDVEQIHRLFVWHSTWLEPVTRESL